MHDIREAAMATGGGKPRQPSVAEERAAVEALPLAERLARQCELKAYLLRDKSLEAITHRDGWNMVAQAEAWEQQAARYRSGELQP